MYLTIDYETAYCSATKYSLRNMTVIEYVRDPRFRSFGASVKVENQPSVWMTHDQLVAYFDTLNWSEVNMIGHNLMFDSFITAFHYGKVAGRYFCTQKMGRYVYGQSIKGHSLADVYLAATGKVAKQKVDALRELDGVFEPTPLQLQRLGEYAQDDADEAYDSFVAMFPHVPAIEHDRISWCIRMFVEPKLMLDPVKLDEVHTFEKTQKQFLLDKVGHEATTMRSNPKFAQLLTDAGVTDIPMKVSKTTGKDTYAFSKDDKEFVDLLDSPLPMVPDLVRCRIRVKTSIEETRAKRLADVHRRMGGWLPVPLNYCGAMPTNRLSGGEKLNLQNLGRGSKLRDAIVAPSGYLICAADLSNIELRIAMAVAKEVGKVQLLAEGQDLYCLFAGKIYKMTVTKQDKTERMVGKVSCLSLNYQSGADTYRQMLFVMGDGMWVDKAFAQGTVQLYRNDHPQLVNTWQALQQYIVAMSQGSGIGNPTGAPLDFTADGIIAPSGFKIKYPKVEGKEGKNQWGGVSMQYTYKRHSKDNPSGRDNIYGGKVLENICQMLAREVLADIQDRVYRQCALLPALQVHDELVYVIPQAWEQTFPRYMEEEMGKALDWWPELPLAAEAAVGMSYGEAK